MAKDYTEITQAILSACKRVREGDATQEPQGLFPVMADVKAGTSRRTVWLGFSHRTQSHIVLGLSPAEENTLPAGETAARFAYLTAASRAERFPLTGFVAEENTFGLAMHLPSEEIESARLAAHLQWLEELLDGTARPGSTETLNTALVEEPVARQNVNLASMAKGWRKI